MRFALGMTLAALVSVVTACSESSSPPPELVVVHRDGLRCAQSVRSPLVRLRGCSVQGCDVEATLEATGRVEVNRMMGGENPRMQRTQACLSASRTQALLRRAPALGGAEERSPEDGPGSRVCLAQVERADGSSRRGDDEAPCVGAPWWSDVIDAAERAHAGSCASLPCRVATHRWTHFYGGHHGGDRTPRFELWEDGRYACDGALRGQLSASSARSLLRWLFTEVDHEELRATPDTGGLDPGELAAIVQAWAPGAEGWLGRRDAEAVQERLARVRPQLCHE